MYVIKRNGRRESVQFDKITARIKKLCYGLNTDFVDSVRIAQKVIVGLYPGVTTSELDTLAAETAAYLTTEHSDYALLAARIAVSNLQKNTLKSFSETVQLLHDYVDERTKRPASLIAEDVYDIIMKNRNLLDSSIIYDRDFNYDYFGFKTLEKSYLLKVNGSIVERPQHMLVCKHIGLP